MNGDFFLCQQKVSQHGSKQIKSVVQIMCTDIMTQLKMFRFRFSGSYSIWKSKNWGLFNNGASIFLWMIDVSLLLWNSGAVCCLTVMFLECPQNFRKVTLCNWEYFLLSLIVSFRYELKLFFGKYVPRISLTRKVTGGNYCVNELYWFALLFNR